MTNSDWSVQLNDMSGSLIDEVMYDISTWIVVEDGYSYELASKGYDNDDGSNWFNVGICWSR